MGRIAVSVLLASMLLFVGCGDPAPKDLTAKAVEHLRRALRDDDRGVRYAAVLALGKAGRATNALGPLLHDSEWCVRQEAAWWLRREGQAALPVLRAAFEGGNAAVRATVAWSLSGLGSAGVPLLKDALEDVDLAVRLEALAATRRLGAPVGTPLASTVRPSVESETLEERVEAALALCEITPLDAAPGFPVLVAEANRPRLTARSEAVKALLRCSANEFVLAGLSNDVKEALHEVRTEVEWEQLREQPRSKPEGLQPGEPPVQPEFRAPAESSRLLRSSSAGERIAAVLDLGRSGVDAALLAPLFRDPERDVRWAAALALGTATGDAEQPLRDALDDADSRVRVAALRSLGHHGAAPGLIAPLLADPVFAVARAAHDALRTIGAPAAVPVAEEMSSGNYAVLHYAVSIFSAVGEAGGRAATTLAGLLSHSDPNAREAAARCLAALGPSGSASAPTLVRALGDGRLNVVTHAALALGVQGLSTELLAALDDRRARVRAYAAFAAGWALGAQRGVDQAPFEVRLPVLAVREAANVPAFAELESLDDTEPAQRRDTLLRGIWSSDPSIAVRCASLLEYDELDAVQSERVMELILPEGLRRGSVVNFDRLRSTIGSSELCACMTYMVRARRTNPPRDVIFSGFHRIARAEHLSPLCWFRRSHESGALEGDGYRPLASNTFASIWMPATYTTVSSRERAALRLGYDPGPDEGAVLRALLHDWLRAPAGGLAQLELWLLNRFQPHANDVGLLLRVARALEDGEDWHTEKGAYLAALRALGRCDDAESLAYLRAVAESDEAPSQRVALAGLARRGDLGARAILVELGRSDRDALLVLLEIEPRTATALLADLLRSEETWREGLGLPDRRSMAATVLGVQLPPEAFIGLEAAVASENIGPRRLGCIAVEVPECRTRRIAQQIFDGLEAVDAVDPLDKDDEGSWGLLQADEIAAFLHAVDANRCLALLRKWAAVKDGAHETRGTWSRTALLRLGDKQSAPLIIAWLRRDRPDGVDELLVENLGGPEAEAYLRDYSLDKRNYEYSRDAALETLARMHGWPADPPLSIESDFPDEQHEQVRNWIRAGRMADVQAAFAATRRRPERVPVWKRMLTETKAGSEQARAALWSVLRAGRYRWCQRQDDRLRTLGADWATLPHWVSDLDSNCCRVSDGLAAYVFERSLGAPEVWGTEGYGVGEPLSQRMTRWLSLMGGRWVYSPLVERWIPVPE